MTYVTSFVVADYKIVYLVLLLKLKDKDWQKLSTKASFSYDSAVVIPAHVRYDKYDSTFKSQLEVFKYDLRLPFYRIQSYHNLLEVLLPDAR